MLAEDKLLKISLEVTTDLPEDVSFSVHSWLYIKHCLGILLLRKLELPVIPDCLVTIVFFFNNEATIS